MGDAIEILRRMRNKARAQQADTSLPRLTPEILPWIDALAEKLVADHLAREAHNDAGSSHERPNHVPLRDLDEAA